MSLPDEPLDRITPEGARDRLDRVRAILWPENDPDEEWSADHLKVIAEILEDLRRPTVACKFCGRAAYAHVAHLHQDGWVGLCCWDERLRTTE